MLKPEPYFDDLTISSKILKTDKKYAIYLPAGYDTSERSYPVLYLLHGGGDDQKAWIQFGEVHAIAGKAIEEGKSTAMIIVMPDASGERRGYTNDPLGEWRYEDYFFEEFMPFIEQKYWIRGEERYRAVAGLSLGGGGTFFTRCAIPSFFRPRVP